MITEFCPGGNLRTFLINSRKTSAKKQVSNYINATSVLNEHQLLTIAVNVAEGMIHLAKQKVDCFPYTSPCFMMTRHTYIYIRLIHQAFFIEILMPIFLAELNLWSIIYYYVRI